MAGPAVNQPGPVTPTGPDAIVPTVSGYDLDKLFPLPPPIVNSPVPNPKVLERTAAVEPQERSLTGAKRGDPEPYVFGRCLADPILIAADDAGDFLIMDWLWSVGECDYIEGMYVDGVNEGRADFLGKMQHFEGTSGQSVSSIMEDQKGSYDTLANKCHSVVSWRSTWSLQVQGAIRGIKCVDPRNSPAVPVYTTNFALHLARILVDCGYTMNWASVATAANYCDEILGSTSPQTRRWHGGGQIKNRASATDWIETFAAYASCFVDRIGGEVYLIPDAPRAANHTVTADDMIAGTVRVTRSGGRNVPESVTVIGKAFNGQEVSYTYGTPGGAGTNTVLQMPFFQNVHSCGRKAEEVYRKARADLTLEFIGFDDGIKRTIGDVGTITNDQFGISAVKMALIENEQVDRGRWRRKYVEYSDSHYSDTIYTATDNDTSLDNPYLPPAGPTPSVVEETYIPYAAEWLEGYEEDAYQRFVVTWTGQTWPYLKDYEVTIVSEGEVVLREYVDHIEKSGSPLTEQEHTLYTSFTLVPGQAYNIQIRLRSNVLAVSQEPGEAWITALVAFYGADNVDRGGGFNEWNDPENVNVDNGVDVASVEWEYDHEPESDYLTLSYSLADAGIPDDATIDWIRLDIRAWKSNNDSVVNLKDLQLIAGATSPQVYGSTKSQALSVFSAIFGDNVYTFEGDLTYWGLTNAQALQFFDDSGNGFVQCVGECVSPLDITTMRLTVDWIKASVRFTP